MQITVLGTGAAIPTKGRYQTGLLVEHDDRTLLVDAGSGVLHRLVETGTSLAAVDTVLLTHCHLDHVADLPSIAKARWLSGDDSFTVVGPAGTEAVLDHLFAVDDLRERLDLRIEEIAPGSHRVAGIDVDARETKHSADGFAYLLADRFTFSGDTEAIPAIADLADGCHALLHDCAYPDDHEDPSNHATPTSLGRTLRDAGADVGAVYLTHLYPEAAERAAEARETVASFVDAEVFVASDGDVITAP